MSVLPETSLARRLGFERSAQGEVTFGGQQLRQSARPRLGAGASSPLGTRTQAGETSQAFLARRGFTPSEISRGREDLVQAARRRQSREDRIFREASGVGEFTAKTDPTGIRQARQDLVAQGSSAGLLGQQRLEREIFDIDTRLAELRPGVQQTFERAGLFGPAQPSGAAISARSQEEKVRTLAQDFVDSGIDADTAVANATRIISAGGPREELRGAAAPRIDPALAALGDRRKREFLDQRGELAAAAEVEPEFAPKTPTGKTAMADIQGLTPEDQQALSPRLKALDRAAESGDPNAVKAAQVSFEKERSRLIARSEKRVTERTKAADTVRTRQSGIVTDMIKGFDADATQAQADLKAFQAQVGQEVEVKNEKGEVTGFTGTVASVAAPANIAATLKRITNIAKRRSAATLINQARSAGETAISPDIARALLTLARGQLEQSVQARIEDLEIQFDKATEAGVPGNPEIVERQIQRVLSEHRPALEATMQALAKRLGLAP